MIIQHIPRSRISLYSCILHLTGQLVLQSAACVATNSTDMPNAKDCLDTQPYPANCCWCSSVAAFDRTLEIARVQTEPALVTLVNIGHFKEILTSPEIADASVVVLSLVGETRAGKSTLLNIIYRYLACHQKKKPRKDIELSDWLYEYEDWKDMRQVFATSSQSTAHTKNVWISKEPFILTRGTFVRHKVAVFLMDTQGLFDVASNSATDSQLFYLSSLLSSTLVVNKMRRLDGLLTKQIAAYIAQMTSVAQSTSLVTSRDGQFLQDLIFLTRDSQFLEPYGWVGGQSALQTAFQQTSNSPLRDMEHAFQQMSCFLMPTIAMNTTNLKILESRLNKDFGIQLQMFLDKIFSPSSIRPKAFYGRPVRARDYALHIELVETLMRNGSFPSVQDVHEGLMARTGLQISEEACSNYRYNMDGTVLFSMEVISDETFERYHVAFLDQAKGHIRASSLLALNRQAVKDAIEKTNRCVEMAKLDYFSKLLLRREASDLKIQQALAEEASRRTAADLQDARNIVQQQSTILAQDNSWSEAFTRPVKLIISCIIGFMALCVLYALITCVSKHFFKSV